MGHDMGNADTTPNPKPAISTGERFRTIGLIVFSSAAIVAFGFCAFMLIPQAIRFDQHVDAMPPNRRGLEESVAGFSWALGITSFVGMGLNLCAILLAARRQWRWPVVLIIASVVAFVSISKAFQPQNFPIRTLDEVIQGNSEYS